MENHALDWAPLAHPAIALHLRRIFGTGEARNFKFGKHWHVPSHGRQNITQKGRGQDPGPNFFYNFKTPSVNLERVKQETSNLVY